MCIEFKMKMAGLVVAVSCNYSFSRKQCKDYLVGEDEHTDLTVAIPEEMVEQEWRAEGEIFSRGYCESICLYREIAKKLLPYDAFVFHAAVIEADGRGYAFAAPSGTGKSTHVRLWQELLGERMRVINGDKPVIRRENGIFYAYGTPWMGKEREGVNDCVPLDGLCFLERGDRNEIRRISAKEAVDRLMFQILLPDSGEEMGIFFTLLNDFLSKVKCYLLYCKIELDAARTAYEGLADRKDEE